MVNSKITIGIVVIVVVLVSISYFFGDDDVKLNSSDLENVKEEVEDNLGQEVIDTDLTKDNKNIINGKNLNERLLEARKNLHSEGSTDRIRADFPDIELIFSDNDERYPEDILPFDHFYSLEVDRTFNFCAIERTIWICKGKIDRRLTDEEMENEERCYVTPIYSEYTS